jgi:ATP-dependent DNA helicase RecQ
MQIHHILKTYWGHSSFRPLQEEIITRILERKDCLALLPTGGGKSICFQVPAMVMNGLCLVVTPLIALMKDQVENLRKKGITAFSIHSGMNRKEVIHTLKTAGDSNCKFLYVSPERLETAIFKEYLFSLGISFIAVDEAHCISQWGYDFRPSYLRIANLREELPDVPILALTASATKQVQDDICDKLLFSEKKILRQSFSRPNLSYSVFRAASKINRIIEILSKVSGTAIVYCRNRKKTREISDLLNLNGISADYYHAGLSQDLRNTRQEAWIKNETRVIVCTNAFGMGIDKPDVRIVIHESTPDCLENYYQEAGRAGRDGKRAYAVLLFTDKEIRSLEESVEVKFPQIDQIRSVYSALMNHLQIASGTGEGNYYDFDLGSFTKHFKLDVNVVMSSLKILEQEGLLYFSEQVFVQPKVEVLADRDTLFEFQRDYPKLESTLTFLLRTYEGILDQPVNINEKTIAASLKKTEEEIINDLATLQRFRIISYSPRKDKPQVYLLQNRQHGDELRLDLKLVAKRREQYLERVAAITDFVQTSTLCRSVMVANYFGDDNVQPCSVCDNCIEKKKKEMPAVPFDDVYSILEKELILEPLSLKEIFAKTNGIPQARVKEIIRFLLAEQRVCVTETGKISLKNTSFPAASTET